MSERFDKLMEGIEANKLTIEELEAIVAVLEQVELVDAVAVAPRRRNDAVVVALNKMRWHIRTAHNEGDE